MAVSIKGVPLSGPAPAAGSVEALAKHIPASPIKPPPAIVSKPVQGFQSAQHTESGKVLQEQSQELQVSPGLNVPVNHAEVYVEGARTLNLGNYQSIRFCVGLRMPCAPADIGPAYDEALTWVGDRLNTLVKKVENGGN